MAIRADLHVEEAQLHRHIHDLVRVYYSPADRIIVSESGTTACDHQGPRHCVPTEGSDARDMAKQINQALDNLETVLKQAGLALDNVVRLNYYTTDLAAFFNAARVFGSRLAAAGCKPASTLLGVASLFHPEIMVEIEATAVA